MPAHGMMVRLALLAGSVKLDRMPGGGGRAGIFDRSAPSGYMERSIKGIHEARNRRLPLSRYCYIGVKKEVADDHFLIDGMWVVTRI